MEGESASLPPALSLGQALGSVTECSRLRAGQDHVNQDAGGPGSVDTASRPALQAHVATSSPRLHLSPTHPSATTFQNLPRPSSNLGTKLHMIKNCLEPSQHCPDAKGENSGLHPLRFAKPGVFTE